MAMAEKSKPDLNVELHRTLNSACRKWSAREIRLRCLPKPSLNRWISEALIDHHRVIEKIRADFPAGELTLQGHGDFQRSADCARGRRHGNRRDQNHVALDMGKVSLSLTKIDDSSEGPKPQEAAQAIRAKI